MKGNCGMNEYIKVHNDNWNFAYSNSGKIFVPFGTNYFDPETGWAPKLWIMFDKKRVQDHFQKMADIGVNTARIFLTAHSFQPKSDMISKEGIEKLDTMIDIAKSHGIKLILTGPDHWEGRPDYWGSDKYAGEPALSALEYFWHEVAGRYKDETVIFAWDLLNEPEVGWKSEAMTEKWRLWLKDKYGTDIAEIPEDRIDKGNKTLYDYQLFREFIAYEWTRRQVEAIRAVDPNHLVTVGFIQWSFPLLRAPWGDKANMPSRYAGFNPIKLADLLDFICIHFYPILGDPGEPELKVKNTHYLQAVVNYCYVNKPVVIEEYGWHGGGEMNGKYQPESYQSDWNTNVVKSTLGLASGWLVWAYADTPTSTDLTKFGGLYNINGELKEWGRSFKSLAEEVTKSELNRRKDIKLADFDEIESLTGDVRNIYDQYLIDSGIK